MAGGTSTEILFFCKPNRTARPGLFCRHFLMMFRRSLSLRKPLGFSPAASVEHSARGVLQWSCQAPREVAAGQAGGVLAAAAQSVTKTHRALKIPRFEACPAHVVFFGTWHCNCLSICYGLIESDVVVLLSECLLAWHVLHRRAASVALPVEELLDPLPLRRLGSLASLRLGAERRRSQERRGTDHLTKKRSCCSAFSADTETWTIAIRSRRDPRGRELR
jgi:hypothetical protein